MKRFHVIGRPWTKTNKTYCACAFTQKVLNFCKMMHEAGHHVTHYGAEGSTPQCSEHVNVITTDEQYRFFGIPDPQKIDSVSYDPNEIYWKIFNSRTASEILTRHQERDFVCIIDGGANRPIADLLNTCKLHVVEYGIGYSNRFAPFQVFESYSHMHSMYRLDHHDPDGNFYHAVIPNYFDPNDFPEGKGDQNYYLFLGRLIPRKGVNIAVKTTQEINAELWIAGQGGIQTEIGIIKTDFGEIHGKHIKYLGHVNTQKRAEIIGNAIAVFCPTMYIEPFGGVNVEAQLCGTPVITTDWGAFPETVEHGKTGYRCRTLEQFVWAAKNVHSLDRNYIRKRAMEKYSLNKVQSMYEEYFSMLYDLWDGGWDTLKSRNNLDWLT